jgi:hypothetical protein
MMDAEEKSQGEASQPARNGGPRACAASVRAVNTWARAY